MASGFVTETELAEARRLRQEEWEKVRTADQPEEAPEEPYDGRSLYDRLQEQKQKKDLEFEEAHKLKNMIKGLDDDEVEFLDLVDKNRMNAERQAQLEERKELNEFRAKVATLQEKRLDEQIQQQVSKPKPTKLPVTSSRTSQKQILAGAVVRKRKLEPDTASTAGPKETSGSSVAPEPSNGEEGKDERVADDEKSNESANNTGGKTVVPGSALRVIGILPGIGSYSGYGEGSDSDNSSDSSDLDTSQPGVDWIGRKIRKTCDEN
ncbi:NEFA-interacting nuclear protein NIP30 [Anopheles darlingi]|uniref:NEFA-interacting nuclear protein NIP30 n=1 Tax=Anopheles darlingi TaxID=43151 RepID=W5JFX7_ANODA|nr:NEFA-interacting nuclear protein NIP30 [Anopheles darlingi]